MEEQNRVFLKGIEMLVEKIIVPASQAHTSKPATLPNEQTREVKPAGPNQKSKSFAVIESKKLGSEWVFSKPKPVITSNVALEKPWFSKQTSTPLRSLTDKREQDKLELLAAVPDMTPHQDNGRSSSHEDDDFPEDADIHEDPFTLEGKRQRSVISSGDEQSPTKSPSYGDQPRTGKTRFGFFNGWNTTSGNDGLEGDLRSNHKVINRNTDKSQNNTFSAEMLNELVESKIKLLLNENEKEKDKSRKENSMLNLSEQLKIEISNRDSATARSYRLTENINFEMFEDYLKSELRIKKLIYILEDNPDALYNEQKIAEDKLKVRDLLINKMDKIYYNKIVNLNEPKEILKKLKEVKRYETKTTSISARKDLDSLKYIPGKESASNFYDRFQEKVRAFENLPDTEVMSEKEKRDYFLQAASNAVPELMSYDSLYKETTGKLLSCDQLKNYLLQVDERRTGKEPNNIVKVFQAQPKNQGQGRRICRGCGMDGHMVADCPHPGKRMCYNCLKIGSHLASQCRKRKADEEGPKDTFQSKRGKSTPQRGRGRGGYVQRNTMEHSQPRGGGFRGGASNRGRGRGYGRGGQTSRRGQSHPEGASSLQAIAENYEGTIRNNSDKIVEFIADSGATEHLSNSRMYFTEYKDNVKSKIDCANKDGSFETKGLGKTEIVAKDNNTFTLDNILYANELSNNLLSLRRFVDSGLEIYLNNKIIDIYDPELNKSIISGKYEKPFWTVKLVVDNDLCNKDKLTNQCKSFYNTRSKKTREASVTDGKIESTKVNCESKEKLNEKRIDNEFIDTVKNRKTHEVDEKINNKTNDQVESKLVNNNSNISETMLWHIRLGHVSKTYLIALAKRNSKLMNLEEIVKNNSISECKTCLQANSIKLPFTSIRARANKPLQIVHGDTPWVR